MYFLTAEKLRTAREYITDPAHWTQGHYGYYVYTYGEIEDAGCYCAVGAVFKACNSSGLPLENELDIVARRAGVDDDDEHRLFIGFNDTHTHEEVLAALDKMADYLDSRPVS